MIQLSEHFRLNEFTRSLTAERFKIVNSPDALSIRNLRYLCLRVLEPIRKEFGYPVHVNSGYRCEKLNKLVNGVRNSFHCSGRAADITAADFSRLCDTVQSLVHKGAIHPREIIYHDTYIHIAYV